jgi:hypothetical protein
MFLVPVITGKALATAGGSELSGTTKVALTPVFVKHSYDKINKIMNKRKSDVNTLVSIVHR